MTLATRLATTLLRLGTGGAARRFHAALTDPAAAQAAILRRLVARNATSRYGLAHGFAAIADERGFQDRVPIVTHDDLVPHLDAIRRGEPGVLTSEPVLMLEKTSGSTAASKYIPYTAALRAEFQAATAAWMHDLYTQRPALRGRPAYWSISPVARAPEVTPGGLPVGIEDDTAYFDPAERWVLARLLRVPGRVCRVPDVATCRYVTIRHLVDAASPGLVSVWNPTFLTLLVKAAGREADRLLADLRAGTLTPPTTLPPALHAALARGLAARPGRAAALAARLHDGAWLGTDLLPDLALISCWTDAAAARFMPELAALFPGVEIQGKGLLATEGVATIPLLGLGACVPALTSHFLEFVPVGAPAERPRLMHGLEPGARYEVLMTTGGGFYRYALRDVVEVTGLAGRVPLLTFVGKAGLVSDVVGEKLNAIHVGEVLDLAMAHLGLAGRFAMLAPAWGAQVAYELYAHVPAEALAPLAAEVELRLRGNHHYAYARDLGQLGPLRGVAVGPEAGERYVAACVALGQRAGDVKPTPLHRDMGWRERFHPIPASEGGA